MNGLPNPEGRTLFDCFESLEARVRALTQRSTIFATIVGKSIEELSGSTSTDAVDRTTTTPEVREQDWYARRILFVTGPHASGKSAVVRAALKEEEGFALFDTGPILRDYHRGDAPHVSFGQWVGVNETQYGTNFTDELLTHHIQTAVITEAVERPSGIIVIGNRSYGGVTYLEDKLTPSDSKILYVDAPPDVLYERYKDREGKYDITPEQFNSILDADVQMGLSELLERADYRMTNDDELAFVAQQLRDYVEAWQPTTL